MSAASEGNHGVRLEIPRLNIPGLAILRMPLLVAAATLLTLVSTLPVVHSVLGGNFADPDDAMRAVEVRAWMSGQSWFDVSAMRLDPPNGASMHWSRLVDVPNALLIRLFALFTPNAELWERIALPTLLLAALYAGAAGLAGVLLGRVSQVTALIGVFLSGATLVQFQPGRIGHHAPETVALVWIVALALAGLERGRTWQAAAAGALVALSLAMSLETLPFLGAVCTAMVAAWIIRGAAVAPTLRAFALGLGGGLPVLFFASVDPGHWFAPVCDALGAAHLGAALIFAAGSLCLAAASRVLSTSPRRFAAATVVAALAMAFVAFAYPTCLHSPFAGVDALVRAMWLDHVAESQPLLAFTRQRPALGLALAIPTLLGALGCLWAALSPRGVGALRFAIVAAISAAGLALSFWQVRVFASVMPLALCGGLFAVISLRERLRAVGLSLAALAAPLAILPFTSIGWLLALPVGGEAGSTGPACLAATAIVPLKTLPPGRVVAPIDAGSYLLEATANSVFAAPYHRNNDGNRFALDVFRAPPDQARTLLATRHVNYVIICPGLGDVSKLAEQAPDSLAARLLAGTVPAFLHPVPVAGTPYRVYAVESQRP